VADAGGCVDKLGWSPSLSNGHGTMHAILKNEELFGWGDNTQANTGAFGTDVPLVTRPYQVPDLWDVSGVTAGFHHTCVLFENWTACCWGEDTGAGYIGQMPATDTTYTTCQSLLGSFRGIAAGYDTTCVIRQDDGSVWCFGDSSGVGALDGVTTGTSNTPVQVGSITWATWVTAGYQYNCAVDATGNAWCWGDNSYGQLASADLTVHLNQVPLSNLAGIIAGIATTCAWTRDGMGYCWGRNSNMNLGDGTTTDNATPVLIDPKVGFITKIASVDDHTCALNADKELWCWGDNTVGAVGSGLGNWAMPMRPILFGVKDFEVSYGATCALARGEVSCWGSNAVNLEGRDASSNTLVPTEVLEDFFDCEKKGKGKGKAKMGKKEDSQKVAGVLGGAAIGVAGAGLLIKKFRKRNYVSLQTV